MKSNKIFYKNNKNDHVYWVDDYEQIGLHEFSFDKETVFNLFEDYPHKLTPEQKQIFDRENPYWANFLKGRKNDERQ